MNRSPLAAVLCAALLAGCAPDSDPLAPSATADTAREAPAPGAPADIGAVRDAADRVAASFEGPAGARLRGALNQVIATAASDGRSRSAAMRAALEAVDAAERDGGPAVAADADAIRLALQATS